MVDGEHVNNQMKRDQRKREPTASGVLSRRQAAEKLGKTVRTIDIWIEKGILPYSRVGRSIYINEADVLALVPVGGGNPGTGGGTKKVDEPKDGAQ